MGMFDDGKKKSESFKPLSEVEIQKKLYGALRPPHLFDQQTFQNTEPAVSPKTFPASEKSSSTDLFVSPLSLPAEKTSPNPAGSGSDKKNIKSNSVNGINRWLDQEAEVLDKNLGTGPAVNGSFVGGSGLQNTKSSGGFFKVLTSAAEIAGQLGAAFIQLIQGVIGSSWKRHFSKLGLLALVLALIVGIQSLNNQRESAMRKPKTVTAPKIVVTEQNLQNAITVPSSVILENKPASKTGAETTAAASGLESNSALNAVPAAVVTTPAAAAKPYVIQVATYVNLIDAQNMLGGIQKSSFPGFIQSMKRQSGRVYHCVFLGRFESYEESDTALRKFKKLPVASSFPDVFIRKLK